MDAKAFVMTLGLGMLAGATAVLMLPQQSQARQMADKCAQKVEHAVCGCH